MNLNEFVKEYGLLLDEEGRYYLINDSDTREEPYCSIKSLSEIFDLSIGTLNSRISNLTPHLGKNQKGRKINFFNLNDVRTSCSDLLDENLLITNKDGWIVRDKQRYNTVRVIAKELDLSESAINKRIKNLKFLKGKKGGRLIILYGLKQVRRVCADLLDKELLIAGKDGWAVKDNRKYATLHIIAKKINLSRRAVERRIKSLATFIGKNRNGTISVFYSLEQVKRACADLLNKSLLIGDVNGWAVKESRRYAPIKVIANGLGLSYDVIKLRSESLTPLKGKGRGNCIRNFYNLEQVKKVCADLLDEKLLIINRDGYAIKNGQKYARIPVIAKKLKLSTRILKPLIKNLKPLAGKNEHGNIYDLYNFEKVMKTCADHFGKDFLIADKNGWAIKNGQRYAPIAIIARKLSLSENALLSRRKSLKPLKGRSNNGNFVNFYSFEKAKRACADLLDKHLLTIGKNGWAKKDGQSFATIAAIQKKLLSISQSAIRSRIKGLKPINGKRRGQIISLFKLEHVKRACADILSEKN
ncbi:MAG: hypothetical protein PHC97_02055 [Patescibacteria group bacterium]|nr:hypothetical protein [Patescibacteria group bacterium]